MNDNRPAMPQTPPEGMGQIRRFFRFPKDMFAALPPKLYRAWMAQVWALGYNSFFINDVELQKRVLNGSPIEYPKSSSVYDSLHELLGNGIFISNGALWEMQRRIITPAFEGGRVKTTFPHMNAACDGLIKRLTVNDAPHDIEFDCSYFASDIIFRLLFSVPIENETATRVFNAFQKYQREQPVWNITSLMRLPSWVPKFRSRKATNSAQTIRDALAEFVDQHAEAIKNNSAPNDLATKIMTTADPVTGHIFTREEMIDQICIFFLAGNETSAAALSWALYLLARDPKNQQRVLDEINVLDGGLSFANINKLTFTRNVFNETLRLYAPVPMMVREATAPDEYRDRQVKAGDLCIVSPWFSGRHERIWDDAHGFNPDRWDDLPKHCKDAFFPFSKGKRICPGAGFAMIEGVLAIARLVQEFEFTLGEVEPIPVAHLTVRAKDGIYLRIKPRVTSAPPIQTT